MLFIAIGALCSGTARRNRQKLRNLLCCGSRTDFITMRFQSTGNALRFRPGNLEHLVVPRWPTCTICYEIEKPIHSGFVVGLRSIIWHPSSAHDDGWTSWIRRGPGVLLLHCVDRSTRAGPWTHSNGRVSIWFEFYSTYQYDNQSPTHARNPDFPSWFASDGSRSY